MADLKKLQKQKLPPAKSAAPPRPEEASANLLRPPRDKKEEIRVLQFKLPESVFDEFTAIAAREMGFRHGAKIELFMRMFEHYKNTMG